MVSPSLGPSQVNKGYPPKTLAAVFDHDLQYGMRPRTIGIGAILSSDPDRPAILDRLHESLHTTHLLFLQPHDIDILLSIFPREEYRPIIQQVVEFAAVDLVEGNPDSEPLVAAQFLEDVVRGEQVQARNVVVGVAQHRVGLAASCLPVREARHLGP